LVLDTVRNSLAHFSVHEAFLDFAGKKMVVDFGPDATKLKSVEKVIYM